VSKILLKGETYSAAPNLQKLRLAEKWRFDGSTIFLDASCLVYDFNGKKLGHVDFSNTSWNGSKPSYEQGQGNGHGEVNGFHNIGCVRHSGDVIDHAKGMGEHTIDIDVKKLPANVMALFFTVSAWTTSLKAVSQPSAHLHDAVSDTEMCRYKLEDQDTGAKTAVIMCKLHRSTASDRWQLTSIGHVGYGRAGTYKPIEKDINKFL
jgi:stress response protein SCP2